MLTRIMHVCSAFLGFLGKGLVMCINPTYGGNLRDDIDGNNCWMECVFFLRETEGADNHSFFRRLHKIGIPCGVGSDSVGRQKRSVRVPVDS